MTLDRQKLEEQIHELYRREHEELGERGTLERLERGRGWDLAPTLVAGGLVAPQPGTAIWGGALPPHILENVGEAEIHVIGVQLKSG